MPQSKYQLHLTIVNYNTESKVLCDTEITEKDKKILCKHCLFLQASEQYEVNIWDHLKNNYSAATNYPQPLHFNTYSKYWLQFRGIKVPFINMGTNLNTRKAQVLQQGEKRSSAKDTLPGQKNYLLYNTVGYNAILLHTMSHAIS